MSNCFSLYIYIQKIPHYSVCKLHDRIHFAIYKTQEYCTLHTLQKLVRLYIILFLNISSNSVFISLFALLLSLMYCCVNLNFSQVGLINLHLILFYLTLNNIKEKYDRHYILVKAGPFTTLISIQLSLTYVYQFKGHRCANMEYQVHKRQILKYLQGNNKVIS